MEDQRYYHHQVDAYMTLFIVNDTHNRLQSSAVSMLVKSTEISDAEVVAV